MRRKLTILLGLGALGAAQLFGQATGLIIGTAQDGSGAVVPGASVEAINERTGISQSAQTDGQGRFNFPRMPVGDYRVEVQSDGFRTFSSGTFRLDADQSRQITAVLEVGQVTEVVTVEGSVAQVETSNATLTEIIDERRITELPLNGRNPIQLIMLVPGVNTGPGGVISQFGAFSVNGARAQSNNYMLDGGDNNDHQGGAPMIVPNPDSLEEFSVQTQNFSAEHGGAMGGVINAVTKSGTNEFHGSAFNFLRNDKLDATSFDANRSGAQKGKLRRNQFGATLGGPIVRNRAFFFYAYEGTRTRQAQAFLHNVATDIERQADFSVSRNKPNDPDTGSPFPNHTIPQSRWNHVAPNYLQALIPNANFIQTRGDGTVLGRISFNRPDNPDRDQHIVRVDQQVTSKQRGTFRMFRNVDDRFRAANVPTLTQNEGFKNWNLQGSHTWTVTPTFLAVGRFTWNQVDQLRGGNPIMFDGQIATYETLGVNAVRAAPFSPEEQAVTWRGSVGGYWNLGQVNVLNTDRQTYHAVYDLLWTRGGHMIKFGGDYRWSKSDRLTNNRVDPQFTFNGNRTNNALGDFFLGFPSRFVMGSLRINRIRNIGSNLYVQDDWKVLPNLTLSMGLRWEPYHQFYSADDELSVFAPGQQSASYPQAPPGLLYASDPSIPRGGAPRDLNNFAPRLGIAWQPSASAKTAIRAGYGLFYDMPVFHSLSQFVNNPPFSMQFDRRQADLNASGATFDEPFRGRVNPFPFSPPRTDQERTAFQFVTPILFGRSVSPNLVAGYNQQWNLNIQRELPYRILVTGAYIGSKASNLPLVLDVNVRPARSSGRPNVRPHSDFTAIREYQSVAYSSYNAFQFTLNKRMSDGFTVLTHYTWSKTIDLYATNDQFNPQNIEDLDAEKALANFHRGHRLVTSFVWDIPSPVKSGPGRAILGGWQINGIYSIQSGDPINVFHGRDIAGTTIGGGQRPNLVGDPLSGVNRSRANILAGGTWFNPDAYEMPARGYFGNLGRNTMISPGDWNLDLGIFKNFNITENMKLQYRWEMFNSLNHANLTNPVGRITSGTVGEILSLTGPRIMQMGLRLEF